MSNTDKAVVVDGIRKTFGSVVALRDISFEVGRGEVLGLLGPNGAGKTTMVDILSTLTRPDRGRAEVAGHDVIVRSGRSAAVDHAHRPARGPRRHADRPREPGDVRSAAGAEEVRRRGRGRRNFSTSSTWSTPRTGVSARIPAACVDASTSPADWWSDPKWCSSTNPRPDWIRAAGRVSGSWWPTSRQAGIATLLTTQYLEEADALSDRIIVIDHGTIIAEGTADELKERTGATYCEIVPRHLKDLPAMAEALGPLLPEENRTALTPASDRIAMPAPDGPQHSGAGPCALGRGEHRIARHRSAPTVARRGVPRADNRSIGDKSRRGQPWQRGRPAAATGCDGRAIA